MAALLRLFPSSCSVNYELCYLNPIKSGKQTAFPNSLLISVRKQDLYTISSNDSNERPGHYLVYCVLSMVSTMCDEFLNRNLNNAVEIDEFSKKAGFVGGIAEMCDLIGLSAIAKASRRYLSYKNKLQFLHEVCHLFQCEMFVQPFFFSL